MSAPTFTKRPAPERGPGVVRYVVDCAHGTTIGDAIPGGYAPTDADVLAVLAEKHERAEGCGCARALARVHGPGARN